MAATRATGSWAEISASRLAGRFRVARWPAGPAARPPSAAFRPVVSCLVASCPDAGSPGAGRGDDDPGAGRSGGDPGAGCVGAGRPDARRVGVRCPGDTSSPGSRSMPAFVPAVC